MIILDATTRSLEVILAGAITTNQLPIVASYVDVTTSAYTPGSSNTVTNNGTAVTAVAAPSASTQRQVKLLTVQNADTVSATVTVRYNDNATTRVLIKVVLTTGDNLVYTDGEGFRILDSSGSVKQGVASSATPQFARLGLGTAADSVAELNLNTGTIKVGGATAKSTIVLSGAGGWASSTSGAAGPTKTEMATGKQNIQTLDFSDSNSKLYAEWGVFMPGNWDAGTITAKFIWTANSTSTNTVVWGLQGYCYANSTTIDQTFGTAQEVSQANTATAYQVHITSATSAITIGGTPAINNYVQFRCYRDSSNGSDNLAVTASLLAIQITYGISNYSAT